MSDHVAVQHGVGKPMETLATRGTVARLQSFAGACRLVARSLQTAVELRLGEKSAGDLEDFVGSLELTNLALQFLDAGISGRGRGGCRRSCLPNPTAQRLGGAADLAGHGRNGGPLRCVGLPDLINHTDGPVTDFRGKLGVLAHMGSILSKGGASAKPGAVHPLTLWTSALLHFLSRQ